MGLQLKITDWLDATCWRWQLEDDDGCFLADHEVHLNPATREYQGFCNLAGYLDFYSPVAPPQQQLRRLGAWVGEQVFGGLRDALRQRARKPAEALRVLVPAQARELLTRPFEIACFGDGQRLDEVGLRLVYQTATASDLPPASGDTLRLLAVFSLPVGANPLNLRRERHELQQLVRRLQQTQRLALELRVLQYGATRQTLQLALEEEDGWDVVHLSAHGRQGELLLETCSGGEDRIDASALAELLEPARRRLKLLLLDACYTGAASHATARVQVGLEGAREDAAAAEDACATPLPSLGHTLAERLDCAVLAMRYPVGDSFATELMLALYARLLERRQRLPAALQSSLQEALERDITPSTLAGLTPVLLGARAAALQLVAPQRAPGPLALPTTGLTIAFPPQPPRFVGRLQPMLRASQALAPHGEQRGVLFHGMPGAGKTACALELAYRHELGRFTGHVWYQAPAAGSDITSSLFGLMHEIQRQLNAPRLGLTEALDDPKSFSQYTLPRLRALLEQDALLLVLDNLETLLTDADGWRVPLWGEVVQALLSHRGLSRVVLTSRRVPAALARHAGLQVEPIHALSLGESVLLARELPRLRGLFTAKADHALLRRLLRVVQGHPKLLELADALAADRAALQRRVEAAEMQAQDNREVLDAFFDKGGAHEGESRQSPEQFMKALQGWTSGVLARLTPTARGLFGFLCRLDAEDRIHGVVQANWADVLRRLGPQHVLAAALSEPEQGLTEVLATLREAGLVGVSNPPLPTQKQQMPVGQPETAAAELPQAPTQWETTDAHYGIHPGVAEAALNGADTALLQATDIKLGDFFVSFFQHGHETEGKGGGEVLTWAARHGVPYLMRTERWEIASQLIEQLLRRDTSPDTLAFALPLLERIAAATAGTEQELVNAGVLANALAHAGRVEEAERGTRDVLARAQAQGNYRVASTASGALLHVLRDRGHLDEALRVAEVGAEYTRQAGLGPWTQLGDECRRLQLLNALGRHEAVRKAVKQLQEHMATLPETSDAPETVTSWNVRETLLDTGHSAALHSKHWDDALALNAEILQQKQARGASALQIARTRFNDYGPLLRLKRFNDARTLLLECRKVADAERDVQLLGNTFSALADLEAATGMQARAADFEQLALGYQYQSGESESCAISHHNLANYIRQSAGNPPAVLAHCLAAAVLRIQMRSGRLPITLQALAKLDLTVMPPSFAQVVAQVESVLGVRFAALFERLPRTFPDGDTALAAVWQGARQTKEQKAAVLTSMPPAIRAAFELEDEAASQALLAALQAMPADEAAEAVRRLHEAKLISRPETPSDPATTLLEQLRPLLQAIAAVAHGDKGPRADVEAVLANLESKGFKLTGPVRRLWAGERDQTALVAGLDATDAQIVVRMLECLAP